MLFAVICQDKPEHLQLRLATRPTHLDYIKSLGEKVRFGGPLLDDDAKPCGSMLVIEANDKEEAEAVVAKDPYALAGLFAQVEVRGWNWVINNPDAA